MSDLGDKYQDYLRESEDRRCDESDALKAEVARLNQHRDELSADKHRHLLEIRRLDAKVERLRAALREVTEYADDMNSYDAGRVARAALKDEDARA